MMPDCPILRRVEATWRETRAGPKYSLARSQLPQWHHLKNPGNLAMMNGRRIPEYSLPACPVKDSGFTTRCLIPWTTKLYLIDPGLGSKVPYCRPPDGLAVLPSRPLDVFCKPISVPGCPPGALTRMAVMSTYNQMNSPNHAAGAQGARV